MRLSKTQKSTSALCFLYCVTSTTPLLLTERLTSSAPAAASSPGRTWRRELGTPPASQPQSLRTDVTRLWCTVTMLHENLNAFSPRSPTERPLKWWWEDKLTQHKRWLIIFLSDDWALIIPLISLILNDLIKTIQTLTQSPRWRRDVASNRQQPKVQRRLQSQRKAANEAGAGKDYPDPNALCILICALKPSTLEKRNSSRLVLHL